MSAVGHERLFTLLRHLAGTVARVGGARRASDEALIEPEIAVVADRDDNAGAGTVFLGIDRGGFGGLDRLVVARLEILRLADALGGELLQGPQRRPQAVTAWTPFSSAAGWTTRFRFSPRALMLAFSSASSAAEGGVSRTLPGTGRAC